MKKIFAVFVVGTVFASLPAFAEQPSQADAKKPEVKVAVTGGTLGAEVAVKPTTYNGSSEPSSSAEVVTGGVQSQGAASFGGRHGLFEWDGKFRLKAGNGNPADANTGASVAPALGGQLAGRGDVGYLPLNLPCGPYLSAGLGFELKGTGMLPLAGKSTDAPAISTPDAQAQVYLRAGAGLACLSEKLVLVVTPFVAARADTLAPGGGGEVGVRGSLMIPDEVLVSLEIARSGEGSGGGTYKSTEKRAALSVKKMLGQKFWVGLDATVADADVKHTAAAPLTDVTYEKTFVPVSIGIEGGLRF